jgi:hypothetical protein
MGEDGLLKYLSELKLPRDAKNFIIEQAIKRKEDISKIVGLEVKRFLEHVNIQEEIRKAIAGLTVKVEASFQIDNAGKPRVSVKRTQATRKRTTTTKR